MMSTIAHHSHGSGLHYTTGLLLDAQAVWQWVQERTIGGGTNSTASVYIYGHSLGSGVAVRLASHLNERGLDGQGPTGK